MTAIELLRDARDMLTLVPDSYNHKDIQQATMLIGQIDAYLSTPPSERAMKMVCDIRAWVMRWLADESDPQVVFEMTDEAAAREVEAFGAPEAQGEA